MHSRVHVHSRSYSVERGSSRTCPKQSCAHFCIRIVGVVGVVVVDVIVIVVVVVVVVDVVVVEGFAGNIALKTAEGTARQISQYLKDAMTRTWTAKLGAMLAQGGFRVLKQKMDPRRVNGGTFLGLNGVVIKSHGGTDALGFASAVDLGHEMAASGLLRRLSADLESFHHVLSDAADG